MFWPGIRDGSGWRCRRTIKSRNTGPRSRLMNDLARALAFFVWLAIVNTSAAQQLIPLTTLLNSRPVGEVNAVLNNDQLRGVDLTPIRAQLEELLPPEEFLKLQTNSAGLVTPEVLEAAGVHTRLDFESLTVELNIEVEKRRTQTLSLLGYSSL